jgi:hypothetical protein
VSDESLSGEPGREEAVGTMVMTRNREAGEPIVDHPLVAPRTVVEVVGVGVAVEQGFKIRRNVVRMRHGNGPFVARRNWTPGKGVDLLGRGSFGGELSPVAVGGVGSRDRLVVTMWREAVVVASWKTAVGAERVPVDGVGIVVHGSLLVSGGE